MRRMTYRLNGTWRCWSLFIGRTKGTGGGFSQGAGMSRLRDRGARGKLTRSPSRNVFRMKCSIRSPAKVAAFVLLWNPYFRTSVSYAARGIEDTWLDLSG